MEEIWKEIPGYPGYEASNFGRLRSLPKKRVPKPRIITQRIHKHYYFCWLKNHNFAVHRLIAMTFIPNPENKPTVNHKDRNKLNNNLNNLEWATWSENTIHSFTHGFRKKPRFSKKEIKRRREFMIERHKLGLVVKRGHGKKFNLSKVSQLFVLYTK